MDDATGAAVISDLSRGTTRSCGELLLMAPDMTERPMEREDDQDEPQQERPPVRPEGRAGHLTPEEKIAIRLEYLEHGGRMTRKAIAAKFRVNRDTVSECLRGPDFEKLQKQFEQELRETAFVGLSRTCCRLLMRGAMQSTSPHSAAITSRRENCSCIRV